MPHRDRAPATASPRTPERAASTAAGTRAGSPDPIRRTPAFYVREVGANVLVAGLYLILFTHILDYYAGLFGGAAPGTGQTKLSALLLLILESPFVIFFLIRRLPTDVAQTARDWVPALTATTLPLFVRVVEGTPDVPLGIVLQVAGIAVVFLAVLSLNRSLGIVPANRGVKTGGLYRVVRHPLYTGHFLAGTGTVISNVSGLNVLLVATTLALLVVRIFNEERFLVRDPRYLAFMQDTRWRLVPFVF